MMRYLMFIVWSFWFIPMIRFLNNAWIDMTGGQTLINDWIVPYIFVVWICGVCYFFSKILQKNDMSGDEENEGQHILFIVEAPNEEQFLAVGATYLQGQAQFLSPPVNGTRIVLNDRRNGDNSTILGTIEEAVESVYSLNEDTWWCAWVRLDRPEDYTELYEKYGWSTGKGDRYRSTSPLIIKTKSDEDSG